MKDMDYIPEGQSSPGDSVFIMIGFTLTALGNFAEGLHLVLSIVLQFTGLCTFLTYLILNWASITKEYNRFFKSKNNGNRNDKKG